MMTVSACITITIPHTLSVKLGSPVSIQLNLNFHMHHSAVAHIAGTLQLSVYIVTIISCTTLHSSYGVLFMVLHLFYSQSDNRRNYFSSVIPYGVSRLSDSFRANAAYTHLAIFFNS